MSNHSLAEKIRYLRIKHGMSLSELAVKSGMNIGAKSYIWALENGTIKSPACDKLFGIAEALNTSVDYLLDDRIPIPNGKEM